MSFVAESAAKAQKPIAAPLPKKFYTLATHKEGQLLLDGRPAKTPGKKIIIAPLSVADRLVDEWNTQVEVINPALMPLTRLLNSIIDGVVDNIQPVKDEIIKFAGSDLICYRAGEAPELLQRQAEVWDPIITYFKEKHHADFKTTPAINFIKQPESSLNILSETLPSNPFQVGALNTITTLTGSALIAIALFQKILSLKDAWIAAHVDEDYQIEKWGGDEEAESRRAARLLEFEAAVSLL